LVSNVDIFMNADTCRKCNNVILIFLGIVLLSLIVELSVHINSERGYRDRLPYLINQGDTAGACQMIRLHPELINANVGHRFHDNATPLMMAAQSGRSEICSNLIAAGANVNVVYEGGETALIRVVESASDETGIIALLLEHGASVTTRDSLGRTPLFIALEDPDHINTNSIAMLLQHGADPNVSNNYGEGLLKMARQNITNENVFNALFSTTHDHDQTIRFVKPADGHQ